MWHLPIGQLEGIIHKVVLVGGHSYTCFNVWYTLCLAECNIFQHQLLMTSSMFMCQRKCVDQKIPLKKLVTNIFIETMLMKSNQHRPTQI